MASKNIQISSWFTASYTCEIHKGAQTASGNMVKSPEIKICESTGYIYNREFGIYQRRYRSSEVSDYL